MYINCRAPSHLLFPNTSSKFLNLVILASTTRGTRLLSTTARSARLGYSSAPRPVVANSSVQHRHLSKVARRAGSRLIPAQRPTTSSLLPSAISKPIVRHFTPTATMSDSAVHNLQSLKEYQEALAQPGAMLIDFFAVWCGPCKVISPKVVEYAKKYTNVRFYKVDVDAVPDVAQELAIKAMPTFKLFKDGEIVDTVVGANPAGIEAAVQKLN